MNKVITIHINGVVYNVDETAYNKLKNYLESLQRHFANTEGKDEILSDIEARIGEILSERIKDRNVVHLEDIDAVLAILGQPDQMEGENEPKETTFDDNSYPGRKRLYRDTDNRMIGGVCSGLEAYFNIDSTWIRLIFVLIVLFGFGTGILIYIILWIVVPPALTTAEKLEMRGEQVNISNIEKKITSDLGDLKNKFSAWGNEVKGMNTAENRQRFTRSVNEVGSGIFRIFSKIVSYIFVFISIMVLIGVTIACLGFTGLISSDVPSEIYDVFRSSNQIKLSALAVWMIVAIPFIGLLYSGIRIMLDSKTRNRWLPQILLGLWLIGIGIGTIMAINIAKGFSLGYSYETEFPIQTVSDTLIIGMNSTNRYISKEYNEGDVAVNIRGEKEMMYEVELNITRSLDDKFHLTAEMQSRAGSKSEAVKYAQGINYNFKQEGNRIILDHHFSLDESAKWRGQTVNLNLLVPEGKVIYLKPELRGMDKDIYPLKGNHPHYISGRSFLLTSSGFFCLDCEEDTF